MAKFDCVEILRYCHVTPNRQNCTALALSHLQRTPKFTRDHDEALDALGSVLLQPVVVQK